MKRCILFGIETLPKETKYMKLRLDMKILFLHILIALKVPTLRRGQSGVKYTFYLH